MDRKTMDLIFAVGQGRTIINFGHHHYCTQHKVFVDRKHMHNCTLLQGVGDLGKFPRLLQKNPISRLSKKEVVEMKVQFGWLAARLDQLEKEKMFIPLRKGFMVSYQKKKSRDEAHKPSGIPQ